MKTLVKPKTLLRCVHGSHLYGTQIAGVSDVDIKGVFLPKLEDVLLSRASKSLTDNTKKNSTEKNTAEDQDVELYSLQYFFKLASEGETVALDMLHASPDHWLETSPSWMVIRAHRHLFYTKNMKAFVGYARRQCGKYSIKGSRLAAAKQVLAVIETGAPFQILAAIWADLPEGEHLSKQGDKYPMEYSMCGRVLQSTITLSYAQGIVQKFISNYGARAKLAETNEFIDWKSVSHAFRAGYQILEILRTGDLQFPLKDAAFLRQVKQGEIHYKELGPKLDDLLDEVEAEAAASTLPEKVNQKEIDKLLLEILRLEYGLPS